MVRVWEDTIDEIDVKKQMINRKIPLLVEICDFSAFNINYDLNTEVIEVYDENKIRNILKFTKSYADRELSPQNLFQTENGVDYNSFMIHFKDPFGENIRINNNFALAKQKQIENELLSILEKNKFTIKTNNIVEIRISVPNAYN
ncbi:hypothetical protein [Mammaliicoccus vitulinus]|uniref:hypothetical protein n=1 Tax=Mammaliicoccus vitulinus TaxID=71237 RepID=UPI00248A9804|nr:hypothetical protein [Mammaliicoccus vitulinus]